MYVLSIEKDLLQSIILSTHGYLFQLEFLKYKVVEHNK